MPEPAWLQEIRYRAEAATKGPWYRNGSYIPGRKSMVVRSPWTDKQRGDLHVAQCAEAKLSKGLIAKTSFGSVDRGRDPEWDNRDADAEFIARARTDVPRLIDAVAEITDALEAAITEVQRRCPRLCDYGGKYMPSGISDNDACAKCRTAECRIPDVISVYRKYRREVEDDD